MNKLDIIFKVSEYGIAFALMVTGIYKDNFALVLGGMVFLFIFTTNDRLNKIEKKLEELK